MAARVAPPAPIGSLFKQPHKAAVRKPRERDAGHLAAIRQCQCLKCGRDRAGEAAHLRITSARHGKRLTGIGEKPDDRWCLPLCHACHMEQHAIGEMTFWAGLDPLRIAQSLWMVSPDIEAMRSVCAKSGRP